MLLIGNGRVVTRNAQNEVLEQGAVLCNGSKIEQIGSTSTMQKQHPDAEFLDARGGLIMPGLINAHNHIYSAFARGLSIRGYNPKSFLDVLEGQWWKLDSCLMLEDTRQSAMAVYLECIKNGVTTIFDHHASFGEIPGSLFAIAEAAQLFGVRSCLCYEVSDRGGAQKAQQAIKENVDFMRHCKTQADDWLQGMMGLHASFTLSDRTLDSCRAHTPIDAGFHIHVAEGMADVQHCLRQYSKRPVYRLQEHEILGEKTICGHCIHVNGGEMALLSESNTMVVHNPESNMGNAVGCPPTLELMRRGIVTGLGTDGYTNDMFESQKVANLLHKHHLCDPTVAWGEVQQMLFAGNAAIGGRYFTTPLGVLAVGAAADIAVADYDPPTPLTADNIGGHTLFGLSGAKVSSTITGGIVRMRNRELVGLDEARITAATREQAASLWTRINQE